MPETRRFRRFAGAPANAETTSPDTSPMIPILWILVAALIGYIGRHRVMGFWGYFLLSLFLGPLIGALVVAISQDMRPRVGT